MILVGNGGSTILRRITFSLDTLFLFLLHCFVLLLIFSSVVLCIVICNLALIGIYDLRLLLLFVVLFAIVALVRRTLKKFDHEHSSLSDLLRRS